MWLVSDHVYEVMLGYDWLRKNKVAWDFANLSVVIDNFAFQLSSRDGPRWCRRVEVQVDTVVPPRCEMDVAGKLVMRNFTTADAWDDGSEGNRNRFVFVADNNT